MVVVRGYGTNQKAVERLAGNTYSFVSSRETVDAKVVDVLKGERRLSYAVLRAAGNLKPGDRYTLAVTFPGDKASSTPRKKTWQWTIAEPDTTAPQFADQTRLGKSVYTRYGCGPAAYVEAHAVLVDSDESRVTYLARAEKHDDPEDVQRAYVTARAGQPLRIGHGMCSGPFRLEPGEDYEVTIWAVDRAGNRSEPWSFDRVRGPSR
jgi:hypothetical protein